MNAINQSGWKPEMGNADETAPATYTGNKALMLEEALIF
jgi:glycine dehydrogenase subunit 2